MKKEYSDFVGIRIPIGMLMKIDEFAEKTKFRDRSTAMRQLMEVGLKIESMKDKVDAWTSEDMNEIKAQLAEGTLVDWIQNMDPKKLEVVTEIFNVERAARTKQQSLTNF